MNKLLSIVSFVLVLRHSEQFIVPDATIEVLKDGSFRAYIPDSNGLRFFAFHARINKPLEMLDPGDFSMEVNEKTGEFWIASFPNADVKVGDQIYYWIFCHVNRLGYPRDGLNVTVTELLNGYPTLRSRCVKAHTVRNGEETCVGDVIIDEQFSGTNINSNNWITEHWMPTYTSPNFLFNSYINSDETRYISNGILHLKPIAFQSENDVRGILDLKNGCTSKIENECYFRSKAWSILPPVRSARITSKRSFRYGKIDVRAKLPAGDWLVPVIHLEQKEKLDGENSPMIWIVYSRGNTHMNGNNQDIGAHVIYGGPVLSQLEPKRSENLVTKRFSNPMYQEFHKYSLEWTAGKMTFSIDDVDYGSIDLTKSLGGPIDERAAFATSSNNEYVISLGVAVGGLTDFPDGYTSGDNPKPWSNTEFRFTKDFFDQRSVWSSTWNGDNAALQVDYVKVTAV